MGFKSGQRNGVQCAHSQLNISRFELIHPYVSFVPHAFKFTITPMHLNPHQGSTAATNSSLTEYGQELAEFKAMQQVSAILHATPPDNLSTHASLPCPHITQ